MRRADLYRWVSTFEGTFGVLVLDDGFQCATVELEWLNNEPEVSCITAGIYVAKRYKSPTHGLCLMLQNVPGRTECEIHAANWGGDKSRGMRCDLLGCIGVGECIAMLAGQRAVIRSGDALKDLLQRVGGDDLQLTIHEVPQ